MTRNRPWRMLGALALLTMTGTGWAGAAETFTADLAGSEEPPPISTPGRGLFVATLNDAETSLGFFLTYFGLEGQAMMAHIHFAPRGVNGGIVAFLCGGGGKPDCPAPGVPATGTVTAADVTGPANQGIAAGEFAELLRALRAGDTYVNVHTSLFPSGEVRGQVK